MDLIVAIFLFLNIINPGEVPTQQMIDANQPVIEQYSHDQSFMDMYESDGIVIFDLETGD
jgi:hypothetical protein